MCRLFGGTVGGAEPVGSAPRRLVHQCGLGEALSLLAAEGGCFAVDDRVRAGHVSGVVAMQFAVVAEVPVAAAGCSATVNSPSAMNERGVLVTGGVDPQPGGISPTQSGTRSTLG